MRNPRKRTLHRLTCGEGGLLVLGCFRTREAGKHWPQPLELLAELPDPPGGTTLQTQGLLRQRVHEAVSVSRRGVSA